MTPVATPSTESSFVAVPRPLPRLAIIGRGFSGLMTAIALLRDYRRPFRLVMFDPAPRIFGGETLSQPTTTLLNTRVRDLSLDPALPEDFRDWLKGNGAAAGKAVPINDGERLDHRFVSREIFSAYAYQRFSEALQQRPDAEVKVLSDAVASIDRPGAAGITVTTLDRERHVFDAVYLATGFGLREAGVETATTEPVREALVIGQGVHAVDGALKLLSLGEARHVTLITRSRFLPRAHAQKAIGSVQPDRPLPGTLRTAFRFLREAAGKAEADGTGWQGIMNGFRQNARELWYRLTPEERSRFKRHVKPIYDSHRNRLPIDHHRRLTQALEDGTISLKRGKVERIARNGVLISGPDGMEVVSAERVLDCRCRPLDPDAPLYRQLLAGGLVCRDELGLGVMVDPAGRALTASGDFHGLFAMGPLGLGSLPDIDLVPEIVLQAHASIAALADWMDAREAETPRMVRAAN
ncbi:FAD/NAD(P)-binding protein [Ensifer soli]|uniref:FAD/NAD(P)-binding protein n=1 Tax=Ciceribacter sp. sgz301302 TaxID=3342379 RepID=UPI0035B867D7